MNVFGSIYSANQSSARFVAITAGLALLVSVLFLLLAAFFFPQSFDGSARELPYGIVRFVVTTALIVPLLESLVLVGIIELLSSFMKNVIGLTATIALLSGVLHGIAHSWMFISGAILFAIMTYSYLFYGHKSFRVRFTIIFFQHFIFNLPGCLYYMIKT